MSAVAIGIIGNRSAGYEVDVSGAGNIEIRMVAIDAGVDDLGGTTGVCPAAHSLDAPRHGLGRSTPTRRTSACADLADQGRRNGRDTILSAAADQPILRQQLLHRCRRHMSRKAVQRTAVNMFDAATDCRNRYAGL